MWFSSVTVAAVSRCPAPCGASSGGENSPPAPPISSVSSCGMRYQGHPRAAARCLGSRPLPSARTTSTLNQRHLAPCGLASLDRRRLSVHVHEVSVHGVVRVHEGQLHLLAERDGDLPEQIPSRRAHPDALLDARDHWLAHRPQLPHPHPA